MNSKKNIYIFFLLIIIGITSCASLIVSNKTKGILINSAVHSSDTLCIIEPFAKVYVKRDDDYGVTLDYLSYWVFNSPPDTCRRFPAGEKQVNCYVKETNQKYLTAFKYKTNLKVTSIDSAIIGRQMDYINQELKDSLLKQLKMTDSLYNVLAKYHYKQFVITYAVEYYDLVRLVQGSNIHTLYRFFIFDMATKSLSFYKYAFGGSHMDPLYLVEYNKKTSEMISEFNKKSISELAQYNPKGISMYTFFRYYDSDIKKYNRKIKRACRRSLRK